jgi:hypothetical protein
MSRRSGAALAAAMCLAGCGQVEKLTRATAEASEASAIATVRTVISAEIAYSVNNGFAYGGLDCLAAPASCVPSDPGRPYLDKAMATGEKSGYTFEFHAGPDAPQAAGRPAGAALTAFAFVATPARAADVGARRFCGDSSGNVCSMAAGTTVSGGQCPANCEVLR